jgi:tetratricopeptide (TPR) repeat protein
MSSWNPFKRKSAKKEDDTGVDPTQGKEPTDYVGFMRRGWVFHSRGEQEKAEADFRRAISYSPESVDANFALGLVMKAQYKNEEAVELFNKCMGLIEQGKIEERDQSEMLRRLTLGHINKLTTGDWNLEAQIWHQAK